MGMYWNLPRPNPVVIQIYKFLTKYTSYNYKRFFFFFFLSEYGYLDDSMKETGVIFHTIHYSFHMRQRQSPSSLQLLSCILGIFAQDRLFWTMSGTEQYGITKKKWVCVGGSSARKKTSSPKRKGGSEVGYLSKSLLIT